MDESALWVKLFTRAGAVGTHDRVTEAIDRTRALEASGQVERCSVATWDKQVVLGDGKSGRSDRGRETLEKIEAFESWAAGRNASLYPFFEERTRGSLLTDGAETVVVLPVLCLTIYEGERLEAVFPRMVDDVSYTVQEGLGALEADDGVSGPPLGLGIEGGESERA